MPTPNPELPVRRAFLAFEGGGAKGLVHLGALHAIEASGRFRIAGVAGTSAGSVVAALVAAGYDAEALFALRGGAAGPFRTILDALGYRDATAIFGRVTWAKLWLLRVLARGGAAWVGAFLAALPVALWAAFGMAGGLLGALPLVLAMVLLGIALACGCASLDGVRKAFDEALRRQCPAAAREGRSVTFRDLPHLKICAANLTRRRLEVFSEQTHPDVAVADAVCASICFPFAFRPYPITIRRREGQGRELFVDGGLLSNLPAWPFDEERRLDPEALTLAIGIRGSDEGRPPAPCGWLWSLIRTAVFGGEVLSTRGAGPVEVLRLGTRIGLFDFDMDKAVARQEVVQAERAARILLNTRVLDFPDLLRATTADLRDRVAEWEAALAVETGIRGTAGEVRVALALPENHLSGGYWTADRRAAVRSLTLRYGAGFEGAADEGLVLPIAGNTVAAAWTDGAPAFRFFGNGPASAGSDAAFAGPENAHRQRRVRPNLGWVLGVPARLPTPDPDGDGHAGEVEAVLVIDSLLQVPEDEGLRAAFVDALSSLIDNEIMPRFAREWLEAADDPGASFEGRQA